ncbi:chemotaxis protein [Escherichia coli]|nr:chemotaxis protein [Escherichia coli]EFA7903261.1 chemotaxis protein [Escherichia coli]
MYAIDSQPERPEQSGDFGLSDRTVTNGAIVIHTQRLKSDPGGNLLS